MDFFHLLCASYDLEIGLNCHAFIDRFKSHFKMGWCDKIDCYNQIVSDLDRTVKERIVVSYFHNQSQTEYVYYFQVDDFHIGA